MTTLRIKYCCISCRQEFTTNNLNKHYNRCKVYGKACKYSYRTGNVCEFCGEEFISNSGRGIHEKSCKLNSNRIIRKYKNGRVAWNKGNRSTPDLRDPEFIGKIGGYRPNAGRSKKFHVYDSFGKYTTLQSSFELAVFEILCELSIRWVRPKALKYDNKNYFSDFYLVDFNAWLDPKNNYKAKLDREKIKKVVEQNNVRVEVILEHQINKEYISRIV